MKSTSLLLDPPALSVALAVASYVASYVALSHFPRRAPTLILIAILVGVFVLFASLTPDAYRSRALSIAIFLGLLATFRLMSSFESAA